MRLNSEKITELKSYLLKGDIMLICKKAGCGRNTFYKVLECADLNQLTQLQKTALDAFIALASRRKKESIRYAIKVADRISLATNVNE